MSDGNTMTIEIQGVEYVIIRRLGWMQQQRIEDKGFSFRVAGEDVKKARGSVDALDDLEFVEVIPNESEQNLMRLSYRLDIRPREAMAIPPSHAAVLVHCIKELEEEEKSEIEELMPGNPTGTKLSG